MNLHLMTVAQFAEYLASQLNYSKIWESRFPKCDFAVADVTEHRQYSYEELVDIHTNEHGAWFGIRAVDFGLDSTTLFAVADMFGGGCDTVCRLYDGIGVIEAEILLQEAIQNAMKGDAVPDHPTNKTFLIVEIREEQTQKVAKTQKYYVKFKVDARFVAEVEAESLEDAKKKATEAFQNADFGEAEDIDADMISVTDENGNYLYEK